jgi:hypothetical protein
MRQYMINFGVARGNVESARGKVKVIVLRADNKMVHAEGKMRRAEAVFTARSGLLKVQVNRHTVG